MLISSGLGVWVVPELAAIADDPGLRDDRPIALGQARRSIIAWHPGRHRPKLAERFPEHPRDHCQTPATNPAGAVRFYEQKNSLRSV